MQLATTKETQLKRSVGVLMVGRHTLLPKKKVLYPFLFLFLHQMGRKRVIVGC
jgi:hypothetical protein